LQSELLKRRVTQGAAKRRRTRHRALHQFRTADLPCTLAPTKTPEPESFGSGVACQSKETADLLVVLVGVYRGELQLFIGLVQQVLGLSRVAIPIRWLAALTFSPACCECL
jgi:hypothetical protein